MGKKEFNPLASNDGASKKRRLPTIINAAAIQQTSKKRKKTVAKPKKKRKPPVPTSTREVVRVPTKLYSTLDYDKKICFSELSPRQLVEKIGDDKQYQRAVVARIFAKAPDLRHEWATLNELEEKTLKYGFETDSEENSSLEFQQVDDDFGSETPKKAKFQPRKTKKAHEKPSKASKPIDFKFVKKYIPKPTFCAEDAFGKLHSTKLLKEIIAHYYAYAKHAEQYNLAKTIYNRDKLALETMGMKYGTFKEYRPLVYFHEGWQKQCYALVGKTENVMSLKKGDAVQLAIVEAKKSQTKSMKKKHEKRLDLFYRVFPEFKDTSKYYSA